MQEISKVMVDLLFCFIIGFLIIQAFNAAQQNQELNNAFIESARIGAESMREDI